MAEQSKLSIGVLGLGIIGGIWSRHYESAGCLAGTWNRTPKPEFPKWTSTAAGVAEAADVIQIVVGDPPAVESVIGSILPQLREGKCVVQSSTIDPESSDRFRSRVMETGARYLEAPFTGSKPAAEAGKTIYYLGGEEDLCAELEPLLAVASAQRLRIGDHRQACALKLSMNLNISAQMQALCEAYALCRRAGISHETFYRALEQNASYSGLSKMKEPALRDRDFSPLFSVKHMHKDMRLASGIEGSEDFQVLATVKAQLAAAEAAGYGDDDFAALAKLLGLA